MRTSLVVMLIGGFAVLTACQKQETEEQRKAEVEREVENRLAAERQAQQQQQLEQRQADLDAREKELADSEAAAAAPGEDKAAPARPRSPVTSDSRRDDDAASYDLFYTRLEPHGSWIETRDYGYVWQPREAESRNWRPYTNGHWVYTDAGWTWVSEEPYGWATYHYGRWTRLRNVGWIWVPGDEWAPAWVSWRKGDDYVGWAPLPPEAQFNRRTGIRNWADSYYDIGPTQYCFVLAAQFGTPRVQRTIVPVEQNITIINRTTNVTNITYNNVTVVNQGPSYDELRSRTQQPIPRLRLERQATAAVAAQPHEPIVRGETIQMAAPVIRRAQRAQRPREIRRAVAQAEVDRGWADLGDSEAVRQTRAKIKSEATPPPDAPSKIIAQTNNRDTTGSTASSADGLTTPAPVNTPAVTASPTATPRETPSPTATQAPAAASPSVTPTPSPTPRPRPGGRPLRPLPSPSPEGTTQESPAAAGGPNAVTPGTPTDNNRPRGGGRLKSQAKRFHPSHIERTAPGAEGTQGASASPSSSPTVSPQTDEGAAIGDAGQPIHQRPKGVRRRAIPGRGQAGRAAPEAQATASPAATSPIASSSPSPTP